VTTSRKRFGICLTDRPESQKKRKFVKPDSDCRSNSTQVDHILSPDSSQVGIHQFDREELSITSSYYEDRISSKRSVGEVGILSPTTHVEDRISHKKISVGEVGNISPVVIPAGIISTSPVPVSDSIPQKSSVDRIEVPQTISHPDPELDIFALLDLDLNRDLIIE